MLHYYKDLNLSVRDRILCVFCIIFYALSFFLFKNGHSYSSFLCLVLMVFCAYHIISTDEEEKKEQANQLYFILMLMLFLALGVFWNIHHDRLEITRFNAYLAFHRCEKISEVVSEESPEKCDISGSCSETQEIIEIEYYCPSIGNKITLDDFKKGSFGVKE